MSLRKKKSTRSKGGIFMGSCIYIFFLLAKVVTSGTHLAPSSYCKWNATCWTYWNSSISLSVLSVNTTFVFFYTWWLLSVLNIFIFKRKIKINHKLRIFPPEMKNKMQNYCQCITLYAYKMKLIENHCNLSKYI